MFALDVCTCGVDDATYEPDGDDTISQINFSASYKGIDMSRDQFRHLISTNALAVNLKFRKKEKTGAHQWSETYIVGGYKCCH